MKHTSVPWKADSKFIQTLICDDLVQLGVSKQANLNLIAAAPDLLEALERAYLDCIKFLNEGDFKRKVEWDAGYIEDALKKARGES